MRQLLAVLCVAVSAPLLTCQIAPTGPLAAPGLNVPYSAIPYALDEFHGEPELVPIHHSTVDVDNHAGANFVGSLAGSFFYKPEVTVELEGQHARTQLHSETPVFYFFSPTDPDTSGDGPKTDVATLALVQARTKKSKRVLSTIRFTQFTGHAKRKDGFVEIEIEKLPNGWLRVTPKGPLPVGEYALMPNPRVQSTFSNVVFDFGVDPNAPEAKDAIKPRSTLKKASAT